MKSPWKIFARYGNPNQPMARAESAAMWSGFPIAMIDVFQHEGRPGFECQISVRGRDMADETRDTPEGAVKAAWALLLRDWGKIGGKYGAALADLPRVLDLRTAKRLLEPLPGPFRGSPPWD